MTNRTAEEWHSDYKQLGEMYTTLLRAYTELANKSQSQEIEIERITNIHTRLLAKYFKLENFLHSVLYKINENHAHEFEEELERWKEIEKE